MSDSAHMVNKPTNKRTVSFTAALAATILSAVACFTVGILAGRSLGFDAGIAHFNSAGSIPPSSSMMRSPTTTPRGPTPTTTKPTRPGAVDPYNPTRSGSFTKPTRSGVVKVPSRGGSTSPPATCRVTPAELKLDLLSADDAHEFATQLAGQRWALATSIVRNRSVTNYGPPPNAGGADTDANLTATLSADGLAGGDSLSRSSQATDMLVAPSECRRMLGACTTPDGCEKLCITSSSSELPRCAVMKGANGTLSACLLAKSSTASRPGPTAVPAFVVDYDDSAFGETVYELSESSPGVVATEQELTVQYSSKARAAATASEGNTAAEVCTDHDDNVDGPDNAVDIAATVSVLSGLRSQINSMLAQANSIAVMPPEARQLKVIGDDDRTKTSEPRTDDAPWRSIVRLIYEPTHVKEGCQVGYCSGVMVSSDIVVTAKHCLYQKGKWSNIWGVMPAEATYDSYFNECKDYSALRADGMLPVTRARLRGGKDLAFMRINPSGAPSYLRPLPWGFEGCPSSRLTMYMAGFPGDDDKQPYLWWDSGRRRAPCFAGMVYYDMDSSGGQSGGPVWKKRSTGSRKVIATHKGSALFNNMGTRHKAGDFASLCDFIDRYSTGPDVCP